MATTHGIILVDCKLKILAVHPTDSNMETWSIPKGGSDEGETSFQAAVRELHEETNFELGKFMNKLVYYEYIGCFPYGIRNKKLKAHVVYIDEELSKMDLELKCNTKIDNSEKLECDIIEWKDLSFCSKFLHHTQITALTKVLKKIIKKSEK